MKTQESPGNFDRYWQAIKRRWPAAFSVFVCVFIILQIATFFKKPYYLAEGKLKFQRTNTTSSLTGVGTEIGKLEPLVSDKSNPLNTETEVIRSIPIVKATINQLNLRNNENLILTTKEFLQRLTVKETKGADILSIAYKDTNPETAAQVVNTLIAVYLEYNIAGHKTQAATARKFIEKQLPNAELVVRQAEAELAVFKERNKIVSLQEEANKSLELITGLQQQISEAQSRFADVEAQSQQIKKQLRMNSQQAIIMTSLSQTSGVQDILREIQQLESQLAARRSVLQDNHPEIINLVYKLQSLNQLLQQRVKNVVGSNSPQPDNNLQLGQLEQQLSARLVDLESTRLGLASQITTLSNLETSYKERLNNLPRLEQQQRQLERKVQAAQSTYSLLLQKLQESRIAENQSLGNASVISQAEVPEESISSPMFLYLSTGLLSSLAALAVVYVLEKIDKSIKTTEQAKELLNFTLLGVIPAFNKPKNYLRGNEEMELYSKRLMVRDAPRSSINEAYRMLRANLKFMSADKELKVIVITSSVPKEGKSTVAANLAITMAQMERKILLVDADMRRPVQHKIWELINNEGLSNLIVGQAEINTAIKQVMDNLYVLTCGVIPPNPGSLLDSKKMAALIQTFSVYYDFVIIDAPSLNVAADAATLGQMADGVLFIVRPGVVDCVSATIAKELLEKSGQNVLGQVINGVFPQHERYSYYYSNEENHEEYASEKSPVRLQLPGS
ncbi:lipopolysaccharide biosynthesis protein [Nostoc linckia z18]|uniref:non-specific protein-tyrosine kinase n=2 Tax=Nostoc linckia TaxID=92942 RepID=A0A9Q6EHW8_NOSLI|nr:polysaccharide biosynthesis tyrosine autokinase [Nostoc linckia]PHK34887.1 lipopolysaccharide biosynthesis protein [Nostoc linckia z15]PHK47728.1 lipopolysaccharide biosynthesis protein [Nostoc linckia z16]PHJ65946.1 lipopolysaccharide biosynthesis protein [Nostoc linckia z1]PHJ68853.1 lipopolysaccharide biosynthesis protein [Nostoc linckia z3]PHJ74504.1 lipopolysaccharide biosynthesis protein [Nostoc linckia z2]